MCIRDSGSTCYASYYGNKCTNKPFFLLLWFIKYTIFQQLHPKRRFLKMSEQIFLTDGCFFSTDQVFFCQSKVNIWQCWLNKTIMSTIWLSTEQKPCYLVAARLSVDGNKNLLTMQDFAVIGFITNSTPTSSEKHGMNNRPCSITTTTQLRYWPQYQLLQQLNKKMTAKI